MRGSWGRGKGSATQFAGPTGAECVSTDDQDRDEAQDHQSASEDFSTGARCAAALSCGRANSTPIAVQPANHSTTVPIRPCIGLYIKRCERCCTQKICCESDVAGDERDCEHLIGIRQLLSRCVSC